RRRAGRAHRPPRARVGPLHRGRCSGAGVGPRDVHHRSASGMTRGGSVAQEPRNAAPLPAHLLEDIVALANDAIIVVDEAHRIALFNRGAEEIFGYTADEAIGQPLSLLVPTPDREEHTEHIRRFGA